MLPLWVPGCNLRFRCTILPTLYSLCVTSCTLLTFVCGLLPPLLSFSSKCPVLLLASPVSHPCSSAAQASFVPELEAELAALSERAHQAEAQAAALEETLKVRGCGVGVPVPSWLPSRLWM